jgi:hypothetical protein
LFLQKVALRGVDFFSGSDILKATVQAMRRKKKSAHVSRAGSASGAAIQPGGGCKILPFRRASSGDSSRANERDYGSVLAETADDWILEERSEFSVVYVPEYSEKAPNRGCASLPAPRWLKRMLLTGTFVAWTAVAIALSIALG